MIKTLATLLTVLILSGCSSINPRTFTNAVIGHASFPSLSMEVSDCVSDYPSVRDEITPPFNRLVDIWQSASKLKPDASLIVALAGARSQVTQAKQDWSLIKSTIIGAGIDCGPAVAYQVQNIEQTFMEIETAILSNDRAVYALEWANLLAAVVLGSRGKVVSL
jgi:hypothetical protein